MGTPWVHQGRLKGHACDCIGLVVQTARALGIAEGYVDPPYGRRPHKGELERTLALHLHPIGDDGLVRPGDVVLIAWRTEPMHLGIIGDHPLGGLSLIHAAIEDQKVVEHALKGYWIDRLISVWRFPGVTD